MKKTIPYFYDPVWQMKTAEAAQRLGYIDVLQLAHLLGITDIYIRLLPTYWNLFQLNDRLGSIPDIGTANKRIGVWFQILERMTCGSVAGIKKGLKPILRLNVYEHDDDAGAFKGIKSPTSSGCFIKLADLKAYFELYKMPLPPILFPSPSAPKARSSQVDKREAIAIAKKYLALCEAQGGKPLICEAVKIIRREEAGKMYVKQTIHDWIKNLFPPESRKPGRPKTTY